MSRGVEEKMKRYRVHFEHAPFAWVELAASSARDAEIKSYQNMIRDLLEYCPEDLGDLDYGEATVEALE